MRGWIPDRFSGELMAFPHGSLVWERPELGDSSAQTHPPPYQALGPGDSPPFVNVLKAGLYHPSGMRTGSGPGGSLASHRTGECENALGATVDLPAYSPWPHSACSPERLAEGRAPSSPRGYGPRRWSALKGEIRSHGPPPDVEVGSRSGF